MPGQGAGVALCLRSDGSVGSHLARCALFARQLGIEAEVCAAEPKLRWRPATLGRIAGEAGYVCWADLGTRWARLIGNQRMLARVT